MHATMTSKGQLTIPKQVRDRLGLHAGDRIEFVEEGDVVMLRKRTFSLDDLGGMLSQYAGDKPIDRDDIEAARREEYEERARHARP